MLMGFMIGFTFNTVLDTYTMIQYWYDPITVDWDTFILKTLVYLSVPTVIGFWLDYFL